MINSWLISWFLLFTTSSLYAQDKAAKAFLDAVMQHDPKVRNILNDRERQSFSTAASLPSGALVLSSDVENGYGFDGEEPTHSINSTLKKPLLSTGSEVSVSHSIIDTSIGRGSSVGLYFRQQLMKNFLGREYQLQKSAAELDIKVNQLSIEESLEAYLADLLNRYLDYSEVAQRVRILNQRLSEAKKLLGHIEAKIASGIALEVDRALSQQQVLENEISLTEQVELQKRFEMMLEQSTGVAIKTLPQPRLKPLDQLLKKSLHGFQGRESLRPFQLLHVRKQKAEFDMELAATADDPILALILGVKSEDTTRYQTSTNRNEAILGLAFEMTIGQDAKKDAEFRASQFALREVQAELAELEQQHRIQIEDYVLAYQRLAKIAKLQRQKIAVTQNLAREQNTRYQKGRIDLDRLVSAEDAVLAARLQLLSYRKSLQQQLVLLGREGDQIYKNEVVAVPWD